MSVLARAGLTRMESDYGKRVESEGGKPMSEKSMAGKTQGKTKWILAEQRGQVIQFEAASKLLRAPS